MVDNKDIPIYQDPGSFHKSPLVGTNNVLYEFSSNGRPYLIKELRKESQEFRVLGHNPVKIAEYLNRAYRILKRNYKDAIVQTSYVVMNDRQGRPTVVTVQPKLEGRSLTEIVMGGDGNTAVRCTRIIEGFEAVRDKSLSDPEWTGLPPKVREFFQEIDLELSNVIETPSGKDILIDF